MNTKKQIMFLVGLFSFLNLYAFENDARNNPTTPGLVDHSWLQDRDFKLCQTTVSVHNSNGHASVNSPASGHNNKAEDKAPLEKGHKESNNPSDDDKPDLVKENGVVTD